MTLLLSRLSAFVARHWLRLLIAGFALILVSRKQVNFNVRLGSPTPVEVPAPAGLPATDATTGQASTLLSDAAVSGTNGDDLAAAEPPQERGFFERFRLFGGGDSDLSRYDLLTRVEEREVAAFLRRFSNVAQAEQEKFGVPPSITLANALLFGKAGLHEAAQQYNSYFALPCGDDWPGPTARAGGHCIRTYETAWTSFRDYSLYVTSGRYAPLRQFGETDYRRWAAGLEELGFNDTEDLAEQLLRTVDRYQLFRYD